MKRSWWYRFCFLLTLFILSVAMVVPTIFDLKEDSSFPVKSKINLGLDLQGGLSMVLGIDFKKVYRDEITSYARKMESLLTNDEEIPTKIGLLSTGDSSDPKHSIVFENNGQKEEAKEILRRFFGSSVRLTGDSPKMLEYGLGTITKTNIEKESVVQSMEVIRNRIDEFGVTEPVIIPQGSDRIIVQLPGVRDIERAKALIGRTAKLSFSMVHDDSALPVNEWLAKAREAKIEYTQGERYSNYLNKLNEFLKEDIPEGYRLVFQRQRNRMTGEMIGQIPYVVEKAPRLTGEMIQDARVGFDPQNNQPQINLSFKSDGAQIFAQITGDNVDKFFAIIFDDNVYSAPQIRERIAGGNAQITMGSGNARQMLEEAQDVSRALRSGALPVALDFLEQRTVGPSLGQDSIEKARLAGLIGTLLVFVFILIYYKISGLIAAVTLGLNILFVLACLVTLGATLTLPGIAGIALTVGMAVDANIVIYERIREEVRRGVSNYKAVENGFNQAFWTLIDANITTALAGFCLFQFGTGPIKGFAVTLLMGIAATLYTSYYVGRLAFEFAMDRVKGQWLSI